MKLDCILLVCGGLYRCSFSGRRKGNMKHFCIQTNDLNVWRSFLADPEKQWKKGYSAYELAHSWTCIWIIKRHRLRTIFLC
ncbi:DUF6946 family protein [Paenibacillus cookii]